MKDTRQILPIISQFAFFFNKTLDQPLQVENLRISLNEFFLNKGVLINEKGGQNGTYHLKTDQFEVKLEKYRLDFMSFNFTNYHIFIVETFNFLQKKSINLCRLGFINQIFTNLIYEDIIDKIFKVNKQFKNLEEFTLRVNEIKNFEFNKSHFECNNIEEISKSQITINNQDNEQSIHHGIMIKKDFNTSHIEKYKINKKILEEFIIQSITFFKNSDILQMKLINNV